MWYCVYLYVVQVLEGTVVYSIGQCTILLIIRACTSTLSPYIPLLPSLYLPYVHPYARRRTHTQARGGDAGPPGDTGSPLPISHGHNPAGPPPWKHTVPLMRSP